MSCSGKTKTKLFIINVRRVILPHRRLSDISRASVQNSKIAKPKPYTIKRGLTVIVMVFLFVLTSYYWANDQFNTNNLALADGQNLVSVYYDGQNKTIATGAQTVQETLNKLNVTLSPGDVVEPALNTKISRGVTNINVYRAFTYVVVDGQKRQAIASGHRSPRKVANQASTTLYPEDHIETKRVENFVGSPSIGQELIIQRATPVVVILAGKRFELRTHAKTVKELFIEKNLDVKLEDVITPSKDAAISPGMQIVVSRVGQRVVVQEEVIGITTTNTVDESKPAGYSAVSQAGSAGRKVLSYLVTEHDGVEQSKNLIEERVTVPMVPRIVVVGPSTLNSSAWAKLRFCESGNNYANKRNPLYRGAYQFDFATWNNYGGYRDPADAPPAVQDAKALDTYKRRGASPWPLCGRFLR